MGTNLIQIMPRRMQMRSGQNSFPRPNRLTRLDAEKLKNEAAYALGVSGIFQRSFTVTSGGEAWSTTVMGLEPAYLAIRDWKLAEGIFFDEDDMRSRRRVAVLGATTASQLFGALDARELPGRQLRIKGENFTVTGVLERKGAGSWGIDQDDVIMTPLDTALTRLGNTTNISSIAISAAGKEYMGAAQREADLILREAHKFSGADTAAFEILNSSDLIDMASETSRSLTTLLAAIAAVSLLVGGIGIMNIMLVSVTERTREIGLRMAVGARKRDILLQFLSESVILSFLGGIIGIVLAAGICRVLDAVGIPTAVSPLVASLSAVFAALVGVFFGFYPAGKAAGLYPVDALRYE
jgi:putative ABC transport system permease protein